METVRLLTSNGIKFKMALCLGIISIIKVPGHSKLNSLEAKGNNLIDISTKNTVLKGINDQISVLV